MDFYFSSLITSHSVFVTHQSSLKIPHHSTQSVFGTIIQLIIAQNFQLFVGPIPVTWYSFYFIYFIFFLQPLVPKFTKPSEKRKKKKKKKKRERIERIPKILCDEEPKKKKKKEEWFKEQWRRKKEKKRVKSCSWPLLVGPSVCLITKMPLEKRLWNLKTPKSCYWKTWNTDKCWE